MVKKSLFFSHTHLTLIKKNEIVRALVIINPGNPTGNTLSEENIRQIVKFAYDHSLVLMADEVYQTNIFLPEQRPFVSFKKVLSSLGAPYSTAVELVSFHSLSKGQVGECGRRGGYFELVNFEPAVEEEVYKLASIRLCPPLQGQIGVDLLVNPPKEGQPSYPLYRKEIDSIHQSLKERSEILLRAFKELEGVDCNPAQVRFFPLELN
jgi:alanine transaminase